MFSCEGQKISILASYLTTPTGTHILMVGGSEQGAAGAVDKPTHLGTRAQALLSRRET